MKTIIHEIVTVCNEMDNHAYDIYNQLSTKVNNDELKSFFTNMADEESQHIKFWMELKTLSKEGYIPQVFSNPEEILGELKVLNGKIEKLYEKLSDNIPIATAFLISYKLEFYLLHPALETLFHYIKTFRDEENPGDSYENHIESFIKALQRFNKESPELELVGETLGRLWKENRTMSTSMMTDFLTRILNRKGFFNSIQPVCHLALRSNEDICFFMIDIDYFKRVNDTHGHQAGDKVLHHVAKILKDSIRKSDIIGRFGGEEFIILFSRFNLTDIPQIAQKILDRVEKETAKDVPVTISIGIYHGRFASDVDHEIGDFIKEADLNLYKAKKYGRNQFVMGPQ